MIAMGVQATQASLQDQGSASFTGSAPYIFMGVTTSGTSRPTLYWTYDDLISARQLMPGIPYTSSFTVKNPYTFPIEYSMSQSLTENSDVAKLITVVVKQGSTTVYSGSFDQFSMANRTLAAGSSESFTSTVTWPTSAVNESTRGKAIIPRIDIMNTSK